MEISDSETASPKTTSQNPTKTMTMEMSPKARGPRTGAWMANKTIAKTCEKTVLAVNQEVGESDGSFFTRDGVSAAHRTVGNAAHKSTDRYPECRGVGGSRLGRFPYFELYQ